MSDKVKHIINDLLEELFRMRCVTLDMQAKKQTKSAEYCMYVGMLRGLWSSLFTIWNHYPEAAILISDRVEEMEEKIRKLYPDD